ncbi:radical SAM family heme chaperone HemW [Postechiella marina]|uniref:Heme chaperone HemW n=1 Tax=Postechiella marina TaxID=943941 RepID=A0ABP8C354_9FLAO
MAGIYIHIPFCKQACFYCDFHFSTSLKKKDDLVLALVKELVLRKEELKNQTINTIYFGGGTPSLLTNKELDVILDAVYKNYTVTTNPEITLEANPDDLSGGRVADLSKSPINRLSIGIQSFFEDDLKSMNRAHSSKEAKKCLLEATRYFDNITIDLIYGIPNMSIEKWNENLQIAFGFGINHISSYALTVEPKTALDAFIETGKYPPLDEALALQHFNHLVKATKAQGFIHYEISNFGKSNYFSKHNTSYWQGKHYIGIGPSAHSFNKTQRSWNVANNAQYIKAIKNNSLPNTIENLSIQDQYNEYVMTGLRTIWGVSLNKIKTDFGDSYLQYLKKASEKFIKEGVLLYDKSNDEASLFILKTTEKGKFLVDGIASELFFLD